MQNRLTLSVCLAVHNEEKNIKRCLDSIIDLADEVIIMDGVSTDNTIKIAQDFGSKIKIYNVLNESMFHINKQKALDKATSVWILQLDADEVVSLDLKKEMVKVLENNSKSNQEIDAYWIPRLNYFLNSPLKKGGQYPDYCLRFYKKGSVNFPCLSIHEQPILKLGKSAYFRNALLHYPYASFNDYLIKWKRYSELDAVELINKQNKPNIIDGLNYFLIKPSVWFLWTFIRHKGFLDLWPGFAFSFFSALRFSFVYYLFLNKYGEK